MTPEAAFAAEFKLWCGKQGYIVIRLNAGSAWFGIPRQITGIGLCIIKPRKVALCKPGTSDLLVIMPNGKCAFVETKAGNYQATDEQKRFIKAMRKLGHKAGVIRSIDDFKKLINEDVVNISDNY